MQGDTNPCERGLILTFTAFSTFTLYASSYIENHLSQIRIYVLIFYSCLLYNKDLEI